MNAIQLKTPDADLVFTYDWSGDIPDGVTLQSVANTLPADLTLTSEQIDIANELSTVQIAGGLHGKIYQVRALATLSEGEDVPASFVIRVSASS